MIHKGAQMPCFAGIAACPANVSFQSFDGALRFRFYQRLLYKSCKPCKCPSRDEDKILKRFVNIGIANGFVPFLLVPSRVLHE